MESADLSGEILYPIRQNNRSIADGKREQHENNRAFLDQEFRRSADAGFEVDNFYIDSNVHALMLSKGVVAFAWRLYCTVSDSFLPRHLEKALSNFG